MRFVTFGFEAMVCVLLLSTPPSTVVPRSVHVPNGSAIVVAAEGVMPVKVYVVDGAHPGSPLVTAAVFLTVATRTVSTPPIFTSNTPMGARAVAVSAVVGLYPGVEPSAPLKMFGDVVRLLAVGHAVGSTSLHVEV